MTLEYQLFVELQKNPFLIPTEPGIMKKYIKLNIILEFFSLTFFSTSGKINILITIRIISMMNRSPKYENKNAIVKLLALSNYIVPAIERIVIQQYPIPPIVMMIEIYFIAVLIVRMNFRLRSTTVDIPDANNVIKIV